MSKGGRDFSVGWLPLGVRALAVVAALIAPLVCSAAATAVPPAPSHPFSACPEFPPNVEACVFAEEATSLSLGRGTTSAPIELQGGLSAPTFYWANPAAGTLPPVGPLLIAGLPPRPELTATIELVSLPPPTAQPPAIQDTEIELNPDNELSEEGTALRLPIKVKLGSKKARLNARLGSECDVTPIVLNLTTGTTSPPAPNKPIKGKAGEVEILDAGEYVIVTDNSLVENAFAEPEATGCGPAGKPRVDKRVTAWVNKILKLPSPAGYNTAILDGTLELYSLV